MAIQLNLPSKTFVPYHGSTNVYVSEHLQIDGNNCGIIQKPFLDYQEMRPITIPKHFNNNTHRFNVHRYTKFSYFNKDELVFIPLDKWEDPYETLFYVGNNINNNLDIQLACMCCTYDRVEGEEASWKRSMYNGSTDTIRISYNYNALCQVLDKIGKQTGLRFYITVVDYSNSIEQLKGVKNPVFNSVEEYISYLTLKRKAFTYENELRIFVVSKKLDFDINGILKIKVPVDNDNLYDSITLPPSKPISRDNVLHDFYSELQFLKNLPLRKELEKLFPPSTICQCRLYELEKSSMERQYKSNKKQNNTIP